MILFFFNYSLKYFLGDLSNPLKSPLMFEYHLIRLIRNASKRKTSTEKQDHDCDYAVCLSSTTISLVFYLLFLFCSRVSDPEVFYNIYKFERNELEWNGILGYGAGKNENSTSISIFLFKKGLRRIRVPR